MGKTDFLSPKAIANRIKSKGLQKLRWYCQMCQKQCRDENGFKCHCMSESHQRQLLLASENPQQFMDYFSEEFRNDFLELLRRRFGTKRVHNNIVYNEYISHREHIHMNATQWETLTDFTKWLGREGLCKVDETPKGWYIQYIDRDPETIRRQQEQEKKKKQDLDDEEKTARFIEQQVRRGLEGKDQVRQPSYNVSGTKEKRNSHFDIPSFDNLIQVTTRKSAQHFYLLASVVKEVIDKYTAVVKVINSGDKLKLDQTHLETVIPAPGKKVLVLNGGYRGNEATLLGINEKSFSATVLIESVSIF
uniref:Kin17 DNA and RNA binding protein n=1 Tax=Pseudonaja textilis TaxID=8673 RepID=A0A670YZP1_PSETE